MVSPKVYFQTYPTLSELFGDQQRIDWSPDTNPVHYDSGLWGSFTRGGEIVRMGQCKCVPTTSIPFSSALLMGPTSNGQDQFPSTPRHNAAYLLLSE